MCSYLNSGTQCYVSRSLIKSQLSRCVTIPLCINLIMHSRNAAPAICIMSECTVLSSEVLQELDVAEERFYSRLVFISGTYYGLLMTMTCQWLHTVRMMVTEASWSCHCRQWKSRSTLHAGSSLLIFLVELWPDTAQDTRYLLLLGFYHSTNLYPLAYLTHIYFLSFFLSP